MERRINFARHCLDGPTGFIEPVCLRSSRLRFYHCVYKSIGPTDKRIPFFNSSQVWEEIETVRHNFLLHTN
jgi:hypothetical protein